MTWILGTAPPFGYAALIGDTRVTWGRNAHRDVLLKIHRVGSMMIAGFAGSVRIGFSMIEDMQRAFEVSTGEVWFPRIAAWSWHRRGRRLFGLAEHSEQRLGCSLLLAGVSAVSNGIPGEMRSYCIKMCAPSFVPTLIPSTIWASIGNGAAHDTALRFADESRETFSQRIHMESLFRGAYATTLASSISTELAREPYAGVSESFVTGLVFGHEIQIRPVRSRINLGEVGERNVGPVALARSRDEFEAWCDRTGLRAAEAISA